MFQGPAADLRGLGMAFGDIRVEDRCEWLLEQITATGSLHPRRIGGTRAREMAVHRFLSSPYVSVEAILSTLGARTAAQCVGRDILVVQDTTEINFAGREGKRRGFGPAGNGEALGFFIHPVIAVDVEEEAVIGPVHAAIWTRSWEQKEARKSRPLEEKESMRWVDGCQASFDILREAARLTMVADAESDIYELFVRRPDGLELIVRAAQNRNLSNEQLLFETVAGAPLLGTNEVRVVPRGPGDKERIAKVELRACTVEIACPRHLARGEIASAIGLSCVEAREVDAPKGKTALLWRLLTTYKVKDLESAKNVTRLYRLRWRIEQVFRALKSDGMAIEESQIVDAERMFNLAAMGLAAAIRTIQLVDARDGSPRPATDLLDEEFSAALKAISRDLEGNTLRQKNPHPPESLAFVAWVAARLGGWNCYYKPPGPKTMRNGWNQLAPMLHGYLLATEGKNP